VVQVFKIRESLELRFKDVLNTQPLLPFYFDRLTRTHVTHTDRVGMNRYLPNPLHISGARAVGVESGSLDGFRNGEVVPHRHLVRAVLIYRQLEYPRK